MTECAADVTEVCRMHAAVFARCDCDCTCGKNPHRVTCRWAIGERGDKAKMRRRP